MKQIFKFLVAVLMITAFPSLQANADSKDEITLTVSADGLTKDDALKNALRTAIEQAYGAFVSANTTILNDELVKDEIVAVSNGSIKEYKEVSAYEKSDGKGCMMTVNATVSLPHLITYAKNHGSECEFAGNTFGIEMKLFNLQKENELKALYNLIPIIEEIAKNTMTWELEISEPKIPRVEPYERYGKKSFKYEDIVIGAISYDKLVNLEDYPEFKNFLMDVCENRENYCGFDVKIYWVPAIERKAEDIHELFRDRPDYKPEYRYEYEGKIEFVETLKDYLREMSLDKNSYRTYGQKGYSVSQLMDRDSGFFDTENYKPYVYYSRLDKDTLVEWYYTLMKKLLELKNNFEIVDAKGAVSNFYQAEILPGTYEDNALNKEQWIGVKSDKNYIVATSSSNNVCLYGGTGLFKPFVLASTNHMATYPYGQIYDFIDIKMYEDYRRETRKIERSKPGWDLKVIVPISVSNNFTSFKIQPKR